MELKRQPIILARINENIERKWRITQEGKFRKNKKKIKIIGQKKGENVL